MIEKSAVGAGEGGLPSRAFKSRASTSIWGGSEVVRKGEPKKRGTIQRIDDRLRGVAVE
jgi:hypothetical protein